MAASIAEILLRVTGDADDARAELRRIAAEVANFARTEAEVDIQIDSAKAKAELAGLRTELAILDDTDIDIDIRRGVAERVLGLTTNVGDLGATIGDTTGAATEAGSSFSKFGDAASTALGSLGPLGLAMPGIVIGLGSALVTAAMAAVAALVTLAASAGAALAALGALAVGAASLLAPAIMLGVAAFKRFKDQSGEAGTAAHGLAQEGQGLANLFMRTLGPAVDAVFRGLTDAIKTIRPTLAGLKAPFEDFGRAVGDAIRMLAEEFAKPAWGRFFAMLARAAGDVAGPLTQAFIQFLRILRDIATAAMPFVVAGFQALADGLKSLRQNMGGVTGIRDAIAAMVPHLVSWWELFKAVGSVILELFKTAAPFGKELVDWLARGARELAKWFQSAAGQREVTRFFITAIPLVKEIVTFIGRMIVALVRFFEIAAPGLAIVLRAINWLIQAWSDAVGKLVGGAGNIGDAFSWLGGAVKTALHGIGDVFSWLWNAIKDIVNGLVTFLSNAWGTIKEAAGTSFRALKSVASTVWGAIKDTVTGAVRGAKQALDTIWASLKDAASSVWRSLKGIASSVWGGIKDAITSAVRTAKQVLGDLWGGIKDAATSVWQSLKGTASNVWDAIKGFITGAVRTAKQTLDDIWSAIKGAASDAWNAVKDKASDIGGAIKGAVQGALDKLEELGADFFNAGVDIIKSMVDGIKSAAGSLIQAAKDVAGKVKDILPGSEPRDPTSPFRGLADSGRAIVRNIAEGINDEIGAIPDSLAVALNPAGGVRTNGFESAIAVAAGSGGAVEENINVTTVGGGPPDPRVLAAQLQIHRRQRRRGRR